MNGSSASSVHRYAIVTGSASGMGLHYARQLAGRGYGLVLVDVNGMALDEQASHLSAEYPVPVLPLCLDLTSNDAADRLLAFCREHKAIVEVLVNNAGMLLTSAIADASTQALSRIVHLHCVTPLLLCRAFVPLMKEEGCGYILNVSSVCAYMDWPIIGMYGNTKRFVKGYSRSLRIECAGSPVSVTTAVFGAVDTPLFSFPPRVRRLLLGCGVMIPPSKAVDKALKGLFARRSVVSPGIATKVAPCLLALIPDWLLSRLARRYAHLFRQ